MLDPPACQPTRFLADPIVLLEPGDVMPSEAPARRARWASSRWRFSFAAILSATSLLEQLRMEILQAGRHKRPTGQHAPFRKRDQS